MDVDVRPDTVLVEGVMPRQEHAAEQSLSQQESQRFLTSGVSEAVTVSVVEMVSVVVEDTVVVVDVSVVVICVMSLVRVTADALFVTLSVL